MNARSVSILLASTIALVSSAVSSDAFAQANQRPLASVESSSGSTATVAIENPLVFDVTVVSVRLTFNQDDGTRVFAYSDAGWSTEIAAGESWTGDLGFHGVDGAAIGEDLSDYDSETVAAGVAISPIVTAVEAAVGGDDMEAVIAQLQIVRERTPPISIGARHFEAELAGAPVDAAEYFDLARMDTLRGQLEGAICEHASQRILDAGSNSRREAVYTELLPWIRESAGLHINCINQEAQIAAAQMLIAGDRPQDALAFSVRADDGSVPPEWVPVYVGAHLSLARAAVDLNAETFNSFDRALQSLLTVHELDPDNGETAAIEANLVPRTVNWITVALERNEMEDVLTMIALLRPQWAEREDVAGVSSTVAEALVASGLRLADQGMYIGARNEFVRGDRLFAGMPEWEGRREDINRARARGVLADGRETASLHTDPTAPERGALVLETAMGMFDLPQEDIDTFNADIANAWVACANHQLEQLAFPRAVDMLESALEVSPTGMTDEIRMSWLVYAEKRYEQGGIFMRGGDIEEVRAALDTADGVDEGRIAAVRSKLTVAQYGLKVGIPVFVFLLTLLYFIVSASKKRRAQKFAELDDI